MTTKSLTFNSSCLHTFYFSYKKTNHNLNILKLQSTIYMKCCPYKFVQPALYGENVIAHYWSIEMLGIKGNNAQA